MYKLTDDMKRGWLDVIKAQCYGLATLLGSTNPLALLLQETCMSLPSGLQGMLEMFNVLAVDYPGMSCACVMSEGRSPATVIRDTCLQRELPVQQRVLLKNMARGLQTDPVNMCFLSMDAGISALSTRLTLCSNTPSLLLST